ncbi:peptidoglycan-binding domain-containing protein [Devosia algicola]|uniref:Peptidoglycan-binding domain-containing protein n=1 Tax=Devosia algicola TaxID=3026418 RepID=A0ABY7YNC4_9HYPH|nr:peptidoglycan-binding domain-containing protein [Devosia algicola]WDR02734.1 peptidoglycan-binding domain-containing protein [Devosia algicola]
MTATTLTHLPLAAGSAIASALGRMGLWALSRYFRAPLTNTALVALVGMTAFAASNALYFQTAIHPAPLFMADPTMPPPIAAPQPQIMPASRVAPLPVVAAPVAEPEPITGSVGAPSTGPVGNTDVYNLQKKLAEMRLFQGELDGYYGPMTAQAIRAFETRNGYKPTGAMSPEIIDAIMRADVQGNVVAPRPQALAAPIPAPVMPAPIAPTHTEAPVMVRATVVEPVQPDRLIGRLPSIEPQDQIGEALNTVAQSAADTIDGIVAAIDGGRSAPVSSRAPVPSQPVGRTQVRQQVAAYVQPAATPAAIVQPAAIQPPAAPVRQATPTANLGVTEKVQRGLASLGFLHGPIDGEAGEDTARAIRNFEVYYNYDVTGRVSPQLVDMLTAAGATF